MASPDEATSAARWALAISAFLRSVTSSTMPSTQRGTPRSSRTAALDMWIQTTRPSLRTQRISIALPLSPPASVRTRS